MAITLHHQTQAAFVERFWRLVAAAYASNGEKVNYERLMAWLSASVTAGSITAEEARTGYNAIFGTSLNAGQFLSQVLAKADTIKSRRDARRSEAAP